MRWTILVIFLFIITVLTIEWLAVLKVYNNLTTTVKSNVKVLDVAKLRFDSYLRDFNKTYNDEERKRRFENFKESLKDIARLNRLENNTVFGLTKFSDMSKKEFADRMLLKPSYTLSCYNMTMTCLPDSLTNCESFINKIYGGEPPLSFDWRKDGVVKPVLNQKRCNGCWAFSIVGVLESMSAIQLHDYNSRSIQELLDCPQGTDGCKGGNVVTAMKYICRKKLQFGTEEEYPMTLPIDEDCKLPKTGYSGPRVKRFEHHCNMDENEMVRKVAEHGPLVVAVDARNWQNYLGGVIRRACSPGISTHVVQLVGYKRFKKPDTETHIPYYIVRDSAGEDFGDQGYVKIAMKQDDISDVCGIADQVTAMDVC